MPKSRVNRLRIMFALELSFIDANKFLSFPRFFPETIVGNPIKPGRKARFAAKAAEVFIGAQKRLLREVISERNVAPDELTEQASDSRLVVTNELSKGVVIVIDKNAGNEVSIG